MENASRTAVMVAAIRAQMSAQPNAICDDRWAMELAGEDGLAHARDYVSAVPASDLWVALRTARLDDVTKHAIASGIRQVAILGAGLDTRAARLANPGVRFFEVDAPLSQRDKRARLARLSGYPMDAATFVECDFEGDDFLDRLVACGLDRNAPALFVWEGVSYYLPEVAVRATLNRVASAAEPSSVIVFDYFGAKFVAGGGNDEEDRQARDKVANMGEPLRFGTSDVLPLLYECGFRRVHVESFDEIALRYTGTYDRARKFRFQALAFASVARDVP
jgi:methyltransferase (TIGR00027 family)